MGITATRPQNGSQRPGPPLRPAVRPLEERTGTVADCRHHWLLTPPHGEIVAGRCKHCGEERLYPARLDDMDRSNDYEDLRSRPARTWEPRVA